MKRRETIETIETTKSKVRDKLCHHPSNLGARRGEGGVGVSSSFYIGWEVVG